MTSTSRPLLQKPVLFLLFAILVVVILYYAKGLLIPVCIAGLLAMLFLPLCRWLEKKGWGRGPAAFVSVLLLVVVVAGLLVLLQWQIRNLASDMTGIEQKVKDFIERVRGYISETFGISEKRQEEIMKKQQSGGSGQVGAMAGGILDVLMGLMVNSILVVVYIFLFLYFRGHLKNFVLKVVKPAERENARVILEKSTGVAQAYLKGLAMMIAALWVMYGIGFSIAGVKSPIFFAVLCGVLEIVPFIGNITGTTLTILFSLTQEGGTSVVIGILIVYAIVQFVQTYILEPLVVGAEVNINPLTTILGIVAAEAVWGIPGMILAVPILGIVRIVFDHIESLQPYGYLIGEKKKKKRSLFKKGKK